MDNNLIYVAIGLAVELGVLWYARKKGQPMLGWWGLVLLNIVCMAYLARSDAVSGGNFFGLLVHLAFLYWLQDWLVRRRAAKSATQVAGSQQ